MTRAAPPSHPALRRRRGRVVTPALAAAALLATSLTLSVTTALDSAPAGAAPGSVTGTVFRDFNADGAMNTTATAALPAVDVGIAGVAVTAYDVTGAQVGTATTGTDGTYTLSYETTTASTAVRVELGVPAGYQPGPHGSGAGIQSGTTVQFVSDGGTANLGLARPGDYSGPDPMLVFPVQRGLDRGTNSFVPDDTPTVYATEYGTTGSPAIGTGAGDLRPQANLGQTGNVWGLANYGTSHVFTGALYKRHAPVGPGGLGAVYLTEIGDGSTPNATVLTTIPNAGTDPRGSTVGYDWFHDIAAFPAVGKIGLGDLDTSVDESTLYAVNLNDRQVWAVPLTAGAGGTPTAGTPTAIPTPLALPGAAVGCDPAAVRPFALEANSQGVWVGLTCTGPTAADLRAYVYRYDETSGAFDAAPAVEFALEGTRGTVHSGRQAAWRPWNDSDFGAGVFGNFYGDPQPILSDIEFDSNDDITLGFKDRAGDQVGMDAGNLTPASTTTYEGMAAGDVLRACRTATGWELESNGSCGGRTGSAPGNGQGPDGGEYYFDNYSAHHQTQLGATEQVPGFTDIVSTAYDPTPTGGVRISGYRKSNNANGGLVEGTTVNGDGRDDCDRCIGTFGKSGGMGDIEALLEPAPIEIGNRVWRDTDGDGTQGPADVEPPIAGVTVTLYDDGGNVVATTVTAPDGSYYFNDGNVPGGIQPGTAYRIALDRPEDYEAGGPLAGHRPTTPNAGANDSIDSDGVTDSSGYPGVSLTTGGPGANDHTFDFGFVNRFDLALRKTLATGQAASVSPGDDVTFTITVFNQGQVDATSVQVTDTLPPGTTLNDPDWTDGGDGTAAITLPGTIAAGGSATVDITVRLGSSVTPGPLVNHAEISGANDPHGVPGDDIDSTPDTDPDDPLVDDEIDNGGGDEDDHDIAEVDVLAFDLALRKTTTADLVAPGDLVPFTVTVFNQGGIPAADVVVTDTPPDGLTFSAADNPGWTLVAGQPTTTIAGPIAPGADTAVTINLRVAAGYGPEDFTNTAEISAATDDDGVVRTDVDSTPDTDPDDDPLVDDVIDNGGGDEDDNDVATVRIFDLALRKTTAAGLVQVGDVVPFEIEVFNQGSVTATSFTVTDHLPAELTFPAAANPSWTVVDGNPTTTLAGPLAPGSSTTVTINLEVVANADRIDNRAEISDAHGPTGEDVTDIDSTPDTDVEDDVLVDNEIGNADGDEDDHDIASIGAPVFDLALRKTLADGQPARVWPGDDVEFTITVFNQGDQAASNIVVTDAVPAGMTFDPASNPGWTLVDGDPTTTIPGPLAPGASTPVTIVLAVAGDTVPGDLVNVAEISGATDESGRPGQDVDSSPDTDPDDDPLVDDEIDNGGGDEDDNDVAEVTVPEFDLALRKTLADGQPSTTYVGEQVRFAITVFNQGDVTATDVVVTDTLPAGLSFDPALNPGWTLVGDQPTTTVAGPIATGESASVELVATVTATSASLVNTAEISSAEDEGGTPRDDVDSTPDTDPEDPLVDDEIDNGGGDEDDNDVAEVASPEFDLALRKALAEGQSSRVYVGETVTYGVTVFNQGEVTAANIDVVDDLPAGLSFDPALNPGWSEAGGQLTTRIAGPLAPGASVQVPLTLQVTRDAGEGIDNLAEISRAEDTLGRTPPDVDSTPDADLDGDTLVDDEIDNAEGDEDDHDIASIDTPVWDLSLRKTLARGQTDTVATGDLVRFTITVFNQGTVAAHDVTVADTIPSSMAFRPADNPGWTIDGGVAETTIAGPIAPGASASVDLALVVESTTAGELRNVAEITGGTDDEGHTPTDVDSVPDRDPDDPLVDDEVDNAGGDEDDNDIAVLTSSGVAGGGEERPPGTPGSPGPGGVGPGSSGPLARTGITVAGLVLLGLGLIGGGFALRSQRRRSGATLA